MDEANDASVLDTFGLDYVLLLAPGVTGSAWQSAATDIATTGFPLKCELLTKSSGDIYAQDEAVLVRPDGIVAASWSASLSAEATPQECLAAVLRLY